MKNYSNFLFLLFALYIIIRRSGTCKPSFVLVRCRNARWMIIYLGCALLHTSNVFLTFTRKGLPTRKYDSDVKGRSLFFLAQLFSSLLLPAGLCCCFLQLCEMLKQSAIFSPLATASSSLYCLCGTFPGLSVCIYMNTHVCILVRPVAVSHFHDLSDVTSERGARTFLPKIGF